MSISPESSIIKRLISGISLNGISGGITDMGMSLLAKYPLLANLLDSVTGASGTFTRSTVKTFIADDLSIDSAAIDVPAYTGSGVLLEPADTNRMLQSNTITSATWVKPNLTATGGQTGVDGLTNATLLTSTTATGALAYLEQVRAGTMTVGQVVVFKAIVKKGTANYFQFNVWNTALTAAVSQTFNLDTGALGYYNGGGGGWSSTSSIKALANGWYECKQVVTAGSNGMVLYAYPSTTNGPTITVAIGTTIYIDRITMQYYDTSPIETTTTAITRTAETLSVPSTGYKTSDFSYYIEYTPRVVPTSFASYILYEDGTAFVGLTDATTFNIGIIISGTPYDVNCVVPVVASTEYKILLSVSPTLITANVNGTISTLAGSFAVTHTNPIVIGGIGSGVSSAVVEANFKYINTANITLAQAEAL